MALNILGVKSIKFGAPGANGTMGTTLAAIPNIVKDTAVFSSDDNEYFENMVEDYDYPIEIIPTRLGKSRLAFSTKDFDPVTLAKLFGGTAGGSTTWDAPTDPVLLTQSIEVITKATKTTPNGMKLEIKLAQIKAKHDMGLKNTDNAKVDVICEVLAPLDASGAELSPYKLTKL
jgi:hypothetical protein